VINSKAAGGRQFLFSSRRFCCLLRPGHDAHFTHLSCAGRSTSTYVQFPRRQQSTNTLSARLRPAPCVASARAACIYTDPQIVPNPTTQLARISRSAALHLRRTSIVLVHHEGSRRGDDASAGAGGRGDGGERRPP
jgi:hypothetical protein